MQADRYLRSIVVAAQEGRHCPPVRVRTTGGDLIIGTPAPAEDFLEAAMPALRRESPIATVDNVHLALGEQECDTEDVLTIVPARLFMSGQADGLKLPGIRIPLSAIAAWWIGGGEVIKAPAQWNIGVGAGIFVDP